MKKINLILIILFAGFSLIAQNNAVDKLFSQYLDNDDFTIVSISGKMLGMLDDSKNDKDVNEINDIISSLKSITILTTEKSPKTFYNEAKDKLYDNDFDELMKIKDKGSNVLFMVRDSNGKTVKELVMLVGEEDNTVLISFIGNIQLNKISKLGKSLNIEGADNLEKLDNNN